MRSTFALLLLLALVGHADAGLTSAATTDVVVTPPSGARVPVDTLWRDERGLPRSLGEAIGGRPTLLIFADFTCSTLCGPVLAFAADALAKSGLRPGTDYRVVVLGLDPKDSAEQAVEMKRERFGESAIASASSFLTGDAVNVRRVTDALGYRFAYDAEHDQFAHPAVVFALTGDSRVARVLTGLGIDPADIRLALVEAGEGRVGTLSDHIRLLCYGFDPVLGAYTVAVRRGLVIVSSLTMVTLAALIGGLSLYSRQRVS